MIYSRFIEGKILEALQESPIILLTGARQTGKTTLAKHLAKSKNWRAQYVTLDDLTIKGAALSDPHGFINNLSLPVVIDEIQLVPELLSPIKLCIDQNRKPGQFLLTGSANVLMLPQISESLAGRIELFTLHSLSQGELSHKKEDFIDQIFSGTLKKSTPLSRMTVWEKVTNGGYPEVIHRSRYERKQIWFRDYITTILQRDIRELAQINGLSNMPRILELLAVRVGSLHNAAEISRALQIPQTSIKRYTSLFEATYLANRILPWSSNLGKRLVKTPKFYFYDVGLAAHLSGQTPETLSKKSLLSGPLLENFVLGELQKQATWSQHTPRIYHYRTQSGIELDFLLELRNGDCFGVEVKAASTVRPEDFKGCRWLQDQLGDKFLAGIVFYLGEKVVSFGKSLWALPISSMWS